MEPAHPVLLDQAQLAALGEITVIFGQIDEIMIQTVASALTIDRAAANAIMGSSKVADNAAIWAEVIRTRGAGPNIAWLTTSALGESKAVSAGRNDFIHAWFERVMGSSYFGAGYYGKRYFGSYFGGKPTVKARRVKKDNWKAVSEIPKLRDRAARLSCLVAHIGHLSAGHPEPSPWLERLAPSLPPRPQPDETRKRGKAR